MHDAESDSSATQLLQRLGSGDQSAAGDLLPLVYDQLRALAGGCFRGQRADHTLQPTALVHEAYLKLIRSDTDWKNRAHFCCVAATAMRQVLLNHARAKRAAKRHATFVDVSDAELQTPDGASLLDMIALDDALTKLKELNEDYARLIELRFFGGLTVDEIASVQGVSARTVRNHWRNARAWMSRELSGGDAS